MSTCLFTTRVLVLTYIATLLILDYVSGLRLLELRVPTHVPFGTRAPLSCRWQLGSDDVLYSVKWYKDGKEFFRYVPRDAEPRRTFELPGISVEKSDGNGSNLTLEPVNIASEGRYRCEVSGEGPLFPTVSDHADMLVVVLPEYGPTISGCLPRYTVGDHVSANCSTGKSRPAMHLSWFVNGEPAPEKSLVTHKELYSDGKTSLLISLNLILSDEHFIRGTLKLKCIATVGTIFWRSNEESFEINHYFPDNATALKKYSETTKTFPPSSNARQIFYSDVLLGISIIIFFYIKH